MFKNEVTKQSSAEIYDRSLGHPTILCSMVKSQITMPVEIPMTERFRAGHVQQQPYVMTLPYYKYFRKKNGLSRLTETRTVDRQYIQPWPRVVLCSWKDVYTIAMPVWANYPDVPSATFSHKQINELLYKIAGDVKQAKAAMPVTLMEWNSTLTGIGNRLINITKAMWAIRRGKFNKALQIMGYGGSRDDNALRFLKRNTRQLASDRLEYAYMWAPTLGEVKSMAEGIAEKVMGRPPQIRIKRAIKNRSQRAVPAELIYSAKTTNFNATFTGVDEIEETLSLWIKLDLVNQYLRDLDEHGWLNPLETLWEIIPFSFVIDQFVSIGDYLASLTAYTGYTYVDGGQSTLVEVHRSGKATGSWTATSTDVSSFGSRYDRVRKELAYFKPDPPLYMPSWSQGPNRILNNVALARLLLKD